MLDIKLIREKHSEIEPLLRAKDASVDLAPILKLDEEVRSCKMQVENLKSERNKVSKQIGEMKRKGEDTSKIMEDVAKKADEIHALDHLVNELESKFNDLLSRLPNIPMDNVKISNNIEDNVCLKEWGERRTFDFQFKNHLELNEIHQFFDFERGAKLAGSGWPTYRGMGARLEWALINYMIDTQLKNGFEMWMTPLAVKPEALYHVGQLPKFEGQQYHIKDEEFDFYLIPTAEVTLNGLHADEILEEETLPKLYTAFTPCFRREAGAAGKNERGLIRTHQFNKVEMFAFCKPDMSKELHAMMVSSAEEILEGLELHYRNMLLVTGDMSFGSAYTVDLEVWLPGQDRYYEVSSISNCTDYQARRSKARFRRKGDKPEFMHTLNGSGLATSRLMVSLLENHQNADGSINVPKALQKYLGTAILNPQ